MSLPALIPSQARLRSPSPSPSSISSSPEPEPDDTDFFTHQGNDSQSSLGLPNSKELETRSSDAQQLPAIHRLPPELRLAIFARVRSHHDLRTCVLVCKRWGNDAIDILWHRPICDDWNRLCKVIQALQAENRYYEYRNFVRRLNLASLCNIINDGTLQSLSVCKRVERITLTNCKSVSDSGLMGLLEGQNFLLALDISGLSGVTDNSIEIIADHCHRLQGLNITGCSQVSDQALTRVAHGCKHLKRVCPFSSAQMQDEVLTLDQLKLNDCSSITDVSVTEVAGACRQLLEIDLQRCSEITDESAISLFQKSRQLRELRLMNCEQLTDRAFCIPSPAARLDSLRILDLTGCELVTDEAVSRIVDNARRLRNLVLAKCRNISDRGVYAITRLGKNLHYLHLGHCLTITDRAVCELAACCTRIRYIDLACCSRLTDTSVKQLAMLPKLRRIGLVKCSAITDESILALATARFQGEIQRATDSGLPIQPWSPSCLERVHLSYCINLTIRAVHKLLNQCPRLTHLSLTGIQVFYNHSKLTEFCREAPSEFTMPQRNVFCVFSGQGVAKLRSWLNARRQSNGEYVYNEDEDDDDQAYDDADRDGEYDAVDSTILPISQENIGQLPHGPGVIPPFAPDFGMYHHSHNGFHMDGVTAAAGYQPLMSHSVELAPSPFQHPPTNDYLMNIGPSQDRHANVHADSAFGLWTTETQSMGLLESAVTQGASNPRGQGPGPSSGDVSHAPDESVGVATGMLGAVHMTDSDQQEAPVNLQ